MLKSIGNGVVSVTHQNNKIIGYVVTGKDGNFWICGTKTSGIFKDPSECTRDLRREYVLQDVIKYENRLSGCPYITAPNCSVYAASTADILSDIVEAMDDPTILYYGKGYGPELDKYIPDEAILYLDKCHVAIIKNQS